MAFINIILNGYYKYYYYYHNNIILMMAFASTLIRDFNQRGLERQRRQLISGSTLLLGARYVIRVLFSPPWILWAENDGKFLHEIEAKQILHEKIFVIRSLKKVF